MKLYIMTYYYDRTKGSWADVFVVVAESLDEAKQKVKNMPDGEGADVSDYSSHEELDIDKAAWIPGY